MSDTSTSGGTGGTRPGRGRRRRDLDGRALGLEHHGEHLALLRFVVDTSTRVPASAPARICRRDAEQPPAIRAIDLPRRARRIRHVPRDGCSHTIAPPSPTAIASSAPVPGASTARSATPSPPAAFACSGTSGNSATGGAARSMTKRSSPGSSSMNAGGSPTALTSSPGPRYSATRSKPSRCAAPRRRMRDVAAQTSMPARCVPCAPAARRLELDHQHAVHAM